LGKKKPVQKGKNNPLNTSLNLPIIDGHCHVFGQALFEGGDVADLAATKHGAALQKFVAYTMERNIDNTKTVLKGVPGIEGHNKVQKGTARVAAVPLLLDMGYTPLDQTLKGFVGALPEAQAYMTEQQQIDRTDKTRPQPDRSKLRTVRLESLYCVETEDLTGDDQIIVRVYNGTEMIKKIPEVVVSDNNQTRMLNEELLVDETTPLLKIVLHEYDWDGDDYLGTKFVDVTKSGWQTLVYKKDDAHYELTVHVEEPTSTKKTSSAPGKNRWELEITHLKCIKQDDSWGSDTTHIEVDTPNPERIHKVDAKTGNRYLVDKKVLFDSSTKIRLFEDSKKLGEVSIAGKESRGSTGTIMMGKTHYELTYNVVPVKEVQDSDRFYPDDKYVWFKRDAQLFRGTIRALSRAIAMYPGQLFAMVPFDPRRPDGLDFVKEAIEEGGFTGVKIYSRCGWMPMNNREIYGDKLGKKLDDRLHELYEYLTDNDLPILNHTSPTGYPPEGELVLPLPYSKGKQATKNFTGPGFPPYWVGASQSTSRYGKPALQAEITRQCNGFFTKYCHYIQKTTSPYAWDPVFKKYPKLRLCFAHSGGDIGTYCRYKKRIDEECKKDDKLKDAFDDSALFEERIKGNPFVDSGAKFRDAFIEHVTKKTYKKRIKLSDPQNRQHGQSYPRSFKESEIETEVTKYLSSTKEWDDWFKAWAKAYPHDWTSKIIQLEKDYDNVYADIAYLSGDEELVFEKLVEKLVKDARDGEQPKDTKVPQIGKTMADKHFIGTDWYMVEVDSMSASDFWNRVRRAMQNTADKVYAPEPNPTGPKNPQGPPAPADIKRWKFWGKWATGNCLTWLNLKPRLENAKGKDKGIEVLNDFFKKNNKHPVTQSLVKVPGWWPDVEKFYDKKAKNEALWWD